MIDFDPTLLSLAPIAFAGALVMGLTGFGASLVTMPLATQLVPLPLALAAFSLVDCVSAWRVGLERPRDAVKSECIRMVPMMIVGIALGVTVLVNLPRQAGNAALGIFVAVYALYALTRRGAEGTVSNRWAYVAGLAGGITGTMFGAGGPPYAIYLSHRPLSKEQLRATLTLTTVFSISLRLVAFALTGLLSHVQVWIAAAIALPAAMLGISVASRLFHRISRETLARAIALVLLVAGLSLMARAAA